MMKYILLSLLLAVFQFIHAQGQQVSNSIFEGADIQIKYTGINTDASDMGPAFVKDELWYSAFSERNIRRITSGRSDRAFYSQFSTPIDENGYLISDIRNDIQDFRTSFHEGPATYSPNTEELFLTLSNFIDVELEVDGLIVKRNRMRLRLVVAKEVDNQWVIQEEMPFNDPVYSVGHPTVSITGDTLFFTSDSPEGNFGKTDIYMAIQTDSTWSAPINLGSKINSGHNEMFPFFHHSGTLIFASDRPGGKGGLDLYYSKLTINGFSEPKPIEQLNSQYDDFGLILHENGQVGYFVSNRPGYDSDDNIFMIEISKKLIAVKGSVVDKLTNEKLPGANVALFDCQNNKLKESQSDSNGGFIFENLPLGCYNVFASKPFYTSDEASVGDDYSAVLKLKPTKELEVIVLDYDSYDPIEGASISMNGGKAVTLGSNALFYARLQDQRTLELDTRAENYLNQTKRISANFEGLKRDTVFMMRREINRTFVLENIYYDLDKWDILPESAIELDKLVTILAENPTIVVELGSHTDSRGSDSYNLLLSQRRSNSAVEYIISKGIPKSRIVAKGYGETQLVNHCENGVWCSEENHRKNRRTEFKILSWD